MAGISPIKILENKNFAEFAAGAAGAVYVTTGIKATARPALIYADKHSDKKMKKYSASKEFIYQAICLLVAMSIVPIFRKAGFAAAKSSLKKLTNENDIKALKDTCISNLKEKAESKHKDFSKKIEEIQNIDITKITKDTKFDHFFNALKNANVSDETKNIVTRVHGGAILGEFVGSLFGLTILSPILSMKVLHPILKACGVENAKPDKSAKA